MDKLRKEYGQMDMEALADEAVLNYFRFNRGNIEKLFTDISPADYIAMRMLMKRVESVGESAKIYLKDIAAKLNFPMPRVSGMVEALQDRGLVKWQHDGRGEDGTYIQITESGAASAAKQQQILKQFYEGVVEAFGKENFVDLLKKVAELDGVMSREIERQENIQ